MRLQVQIQTGRDEEPKCFLSGISKNHRARCANELARIGYLFSQMQPVEFSLIERYEQIENSNKHTGDSLIIYLTVPSPTKLLLRDIRVVDRAEVVRRLISLGFLVFKYRCSLLSNLPTSTIALLPSPNQTLQISTEPLSELDLNFF